MSLTRSCFKPRSRKVDRPCTFDPKAASNLAGFQKIDAFAGRARLGYGEPYRYRRHGGSLGQSMAITLAKEKRARKGLTGEEKL